MKLIAVVSWYDESPSWLAQCVASLARFADHIVAVDGAYALFPDAAGRSPLEQHEAVVGAAYAAGVPLTLHWQKQPFEGNEVEKRNQTLKLARAVAGPGDWLIVVDADEYVLHAAESLRAELAATDRHVATYALFDGLDLQENPSMAAAARVASMMTRFSSPVRGIYRNLPDLEYVGTHYSLRATIDGQPRWLWGIEQMHGADNILPALNLTHALHVAHRNRFRSKVRHQAALEYYDRRDRFGIEPIRQVFMETVDGGVGQVA